MARLRAEAGATTGRGSVAARVQGKPDARDIQAALAELGYDIGTVDGIWGPRSQRALDSFRKTLTDPPSGDPVGTDLAALTAALDPAPPVPEVWLIALPVVDRTAPFHALPLGMIEDGARIALVEDGAPPPARGRAQTFPVDGPARLTAPDRAGRYDLVLIDASGVERARLAISVQ